MVNAFSPASFTKNFGWEHDYSSLREAIGAGFGGGVAPVRVETWRAQSGLPDRDRELIPLRFFLFLQRGPDADYVLPDELVLRAVSGGYASDFPPLALFAFHLARSGKWRGSRWPSGRVAGWANDFIREEAWSGDAWRYEAFGDQALESYIRGHVNGELHTLHKVFTNYRYMLRISGIMKPGIATGPVPFVAKIWAERACKLLWDRATYNGDLDETAPETDLIDYFLLADGYKLLGTSASQGRVIAGLAAADYKADGGIARFA